MRGLTPQFLAPVAVLVAVFGAAALVGTAGFALFLGAMAATAVGVVLAARARLRLEAIAEALRANAADIPDAAPAVDEIDELTQEVGRFLRRAASQHRGDAEELEHHAFVLDRMNDGLMRVRADGRVAYANVAAGALFGGSNPTGQSFLRVTRDHELHDAVRRCLATGQEQQHTFEIPGEARLVNAAIARVEGDATEAIVMLRDITEVNRLQNLRRDFVANISHELRTPLSTIKILAETLLDLREDDAEAVEFLTKIDGEIDVMTALVRDLLDLSQLESQAGALALRPADPARIARDVRERLSAIADRQRVTFTVDAADELPPLTADERRLHQALLNLASNAIAHTPAGGMVTICVRADSDAVVYTVRDTGHGIAEHDLSRIWERFFKTDRSRASSGTGLGLAIVKHIVLAHGGTVDASSTLGVGSEFRITIPRRPVLARRG